MKRILLSLIVVFAVISCSPFSLEKCQVLNDADLSSYKTFMLEQIDESDLPTRFMQSDLQNIYDAISDEMTSRGYKQVSSNADLLVYMAVSVKDELETNVESTTVPVGYRYNYFGRGPVRLAGGFHGAISTPTEITTEVVKEGYLMLDLVDTKTNNHVFYSEIKTAADGTKYRDLNMLKAAAQKLFSQFPVEQAK